MSKRNGTIVIAAAAASYLSILAVGESLAAQRAAEDSRSVENLPAGEGSATLRTSCLMCHGTALIVQQRLSREGWSRELDKMIGWGAVVPDAEQSSLLDYLTSYFGAESNQPGAEPVEAATALLKTRCQTCHDLRLIEQQRLDSAGWTREIDKMIGWGAQLTDSEKQALVAYLVARIN
jgi:cytochrome c5